MDNAINIAKYAVTRCLDKGTPISNLQLQKILFFIQRTFLQNGPPAFPERIEAWQYGPVVPTVYNYFCGSGATPILMRYNNSIEGNTDTIDQIIDEKCKLNPWEMVKDTHKSGGSWHTVYRGGEGRFDEIPQHLIKDLG